MKLLKCDICGRLVACCAQEIVTDLDDKDVRVFIRYSGFRLSNPMVQADFCEECIKKLILSTKKPTPQGADNSPEGQH